MEMQKEEMKEKKVIKYGEINDDFGKNVPW
jgi:hypothetical protein